VQLALDATSARESIGDQICINDYDQGKLPVEESGLFCWVSIVIHVSPEGAALVLKNTRK